MLYSNININNDFGTDASFFNPFGPNFLTLTIDEGVRLKLLECVKDHSINAWEEPHIISSYTSQKNSIVDGTLGDIKPEWQKKYHGNIIMKTLSKLLHRYCELANMPEVVPEILNVWYVIMKSGDFHLIHNHTPEDKPHCKLSGAIYLDAGTAGDMTQTAPSSDGQFVVVIGVALEPDVIYVNPSLDIIEHD